MTNQDAIYYLQYLRHDIVKDSPYDVAIVTAIASLTEKKQKTNGDRLRNMSDEQLAEFIDTVTDCCSDGWMCDKCPIKSIGCDKDSFIEWLKQEVSEDAEPD